MCVKSVSNSQTAFAFYAHTEVQCNDTPAHFSIITVRDRVQSEYVSLAAGAVAACVSERDRELSVETEWKLQWENTVSSYASV